MIVRHAYLDTTIHICRAHYETGNAPGFGPLGPVEDARDSGCAVCEAAKVADADIRTLRREAGTAGDMAQVELCDLVLGDLDRLPGWTLETARAECVRVILAARAALV